ncbi:protein NEN [Salix suchowensis]|nr:protein NEN [Salix suchowensis]
MEASSSCPVSASEIVFFDLETTCPIKLDNVCPRKLVELDSYSTLVRPTDLSAVALKSGRCDGITREAVANAPAFGEVADKIFSILNGRIWAGHNIRRFDCVRIKEAFAEIGRPAPMPVGMIDSLGVLTEKFGRRAGNMKMATLATYFGLASKNTGMNKSLEDVRMNLEVLKHCATESSLPSVMSGKWHNPSTMVTRSRSNGKLLCREENSRKSPPTTLGYQRAVPIQGEAWERFELYIAFNMTEGVKNLLCKAQETKSFNNILKHSHSLFR